MPIASVTHTHFQQAINNCIDRPRTCEQIYMTFRQIIKSAIRDALLPRTAFDDVCTDISLPKYPKPRKRALTPREIDAVKRVRMDERRMSFLMLLYGCGLRRSEALALTPEDFDFQSGTVSITKDLIFIDNDPMIKSYPKTDRGYRVIPVPAAIMGIIKPFVLSSSARSIGIFPAVSLQRPDMSKCGILLSGI